MWIPLETKNQPWSSLTQTTFTGKSERPFLLQGLEDIHQALISDGPGVSLVSKEKSFFWSSQVNFCLTWNSSCSLVVLCRFQMALRSSRSTRDSSCTMLATTPCSKWTRWWRKFSVVPVSFQIVWAADQSYQDLPHAAFIQYTSTQEKPVGFCCVCCQKKFSLEDWIGCFSFSTRSIWRKKKRRSSCTTGKPGCNTKTLCGREWLNEYHKPSTPTDNWRTDLQIIFKNNSNVFLATSFHGIRKGRRVCWFSPSVFWVCFRFVFFHCWIFSSLPSRCCFWSPLNTNIIFKENRFFNKSITSTYHFATESITKGTTESAIDTSNDLWRFQVVNLFWTMITSFSLPYFYLFCHRYSVTALSKLGLHQLWQLFF